jgi:nicotinamide phosphoribosyltransferase
MGSQPINPLNLADSYKVGHYSMYPKGMTHLQSNWTPRSSRIPEVSHVAFFGLQAYLARITEAFDPLFGITGTMLIQDHQRRVEGLLGQAFDTSHWEALRDLGYLPLRFCALPEGTMVPLRVPMFTIENTVPGFGWLVNYLESVMSAEIWQPMTSLTIALRYRKLLDEWASKTSDTPEFVDWQGHDFSFRGLAGAMSGAASGAGHLLAFAGSDTLAAMDWAREYYDARGFVGGSVPATEHSVMCAGGRGTEKETIHRLLTEFPKGIISIVSDTWDLWYVITKILPELEPHILGREGKLVIRPDSGDPVKIICGDPDAPVGSPPWKGVIELLWDIFGGTVNSKGFRVLDPHIGAIYGDSITLERAGAICKGLADKGFASTNIVFGIGSFTYQYVTRDTFGFAMKATWARIDGVEHSLFKDPVTDDGMKKSAKGRLAVGRRAGSTLADDSGELMLVNNATPDQEAKSLLQPVWEDSKFLVRHTYREIATRLGARKLLPE